MSRPTSRPIGLSFAPGGLLIGDDCITEFPGVARACAAFARRHGLVPDVHGVKFVLRKPTAARDVETAPGAVRPAA